MASLLERMNMNKPSSGPIRSQPNRNSTRSPYNRPPAGDSNSQWSHDLYDDSLAARLNVSSASGEAKPRSTDAAIFRKAMSGVKSGNGSSSSLNIKGAAVSGNVVDVGGLLEGTTPEDVAAIFKTCGEITKSSLTKPLPNTDGVTVRLSFKTSSSAAAAVKKFDKQNADGRELTVRIAGLGSSGSTLVGRFGDDGLDVVRGEGSVDVLMDSEMDGHSKMRSDSLKNDPRAHVLIAPPGANPAEYAQGTRGGGGRRRPGRGRGGGGRPRRGGFSRMDTD